VSQPYLVCFQCIVMALVQSPSREGFTHCSSDSDSDSDSDSRVLDEMA